MKKIVLREDEMPGIPARNPVDQPPGQIRTHASQGFQILFPQDLNALFGEFATRVVECAYIEAVVAHGLCAIEHRAQRGLVTE